MHLFDIYVDDLTIYMNRHKSDNKKNQETVKNTLEVIELFFVWSGLKINRGKTYLSIFWSKSGMSEVCDYVGDKIEYRV